ncbi:MAG: glycosyltransferase [Verrucomicrobiales bacterium]
MPGLYAAFDRFPSPKGAGTHIAHAAAALLEHAGGGVLAALREEDEPEALPQDPGGTLERFYHPSPNLLVRADAFASWLWDNLSGKWEAAFCQFRDPWGGVPIAEARAGKSPLIYEVNGLPSVEMPYHFPKLAASAVEKLRSLERYCLERCDGVIVPSAVIRDNLVKAGVPGKKVAVIPNGAAIPGPAPGRRARRAGI